MGVFITFEGPDGSGKSTIINKVYEYLKNKKIDVIKTREPGGTEISEKIRDIILDVNNKKMDSRTEALLYAASRAQHVKELIKPSLKQGKVVLSDRFVLSSLAYQGYGRDLGFEDVKMINDFATDKLEPDLILFFKVDPIVTLQRKSSLETADRLEKEKEAFHKKVYLGYLDILDKNKDNEKLHIIDATKDVDEVFKSTIEVINKYIMY